MLRHLLLLTVIASLSAPLLAQTPQGWRIQSRTYVPSEIGPRR